MNITIYTDASTRTVGRRHYLGLSAVMLTEGIPGYNHWTSVVQSTRENSTLGEILAIEIALAKIPPRARGRYQVQLYTDCLSVAEMLKRGGAEAKQRHAYRRVRALLASFETATVEWCRGHAGNRWNQIADQLARGVLAEIV